MGALRRLNDDLGTTVVVAEHRLERAAPLADRAVVLAGSLFAPQVLRVLPPFLTVAEVAEARRQAEGRG